MKILIRRDKPVIKEDTLDIFASSTKIAKLKVVNVENDSMNNTQNVACEVIKCHPEYSQSLNIFNNHNGHVQLKIELTK